MAKVKTGPKVKRKGGGIPAKTKKVASLADQLTATKAVVVTEYRGLTVRELQELRRKLRSKGVEYHVVKNSLLKRAAEASGKRGLETLLTGPSAVAVGTGDEVDLAKGVVDELRTYRAMKLVGAWVGGQTMKAEDVQSLARLPGLAHLRGTFVGTLQAPLANVVGMLTAAQGQLIRVLTARTA